MKPARTPDAAPRSPALPAQAGDRLPRSAAPEQPPSELKTDVAELPAEQQELVERMLVQGATFEDVVDAVNERGPATITQQAVENFFRGNLDLQKRRVLHQVEKAQALMGTLGNPETAEGRLARAALFTGFMQLHRDTAAVSLREADNARLARENLRLKQHVLILRRNNLVQERAYKQARARFMQLKVQKLKAELHQLQRALNAAGAQRWLGPEAFQKIQEIYGLISEPFVPEEGAHAPSQA
jgi:hypothetical protein